jgi:XrtJ-associated TM-motif-TM protein
MRRLISVSIFGLMILHLAAPPAHALGGCVDSPENPSIILGFIAAGVGLIPLIRSRNRSRSDHK